MNCKLLVIFICILVETECSEVVELNHQIFKSAKIPSDENSKVSEQVHLNINKYCLNKWLNKTFGDQMKSRYLSFKGTNQMDIHPITDESLALAVSLKTGIYNETHIGVKRETALNVTIKMIISLAKAHRVNSGHGWGSGWQTAQWAYDMGLGAWLLWSDIKDPVDRNYIEKAIVFEANRFIDYKVPYYQDMKGHVVYPGDTKAEENGWNSRVLQLSTVMLPKHPNHKKWMNKMIELMVSSYSRPSDLSSNLLINGKSVKDWLNGTNMFENGTVVNHNRLHPDYMQCVAYLLGTSITYALVGQPVPEAAFHNNDIVYRAFSELKFLSPPYHKPGGSIYVRSVDGKALTGDIYYPQYDDWGTGLRMHFAALDSMVSHFTKHGAMYRSEEWHKQHIHEVLRMQNRFTDGHTYANKTEDSSPMSEEWMAQWSSFNYLSRWVGTNFNITTTNESFA